MPDLVGRSLRGAARPLIGFNEVAKIAKGGQSWRIGTSAQVGWIANGTSIDQTITSAIPPVFAAYAALWESDDDRVSTTVYAENWGSDMTFDDTLRGTQEDALRDLLMGSRLVVDALNGLSGCALPNWLLSAGVIAQTVWNAAHGFDACYGVRDLDVVYFDPDTRRDAEDAAANDVTSRLGGLGFQVDVKNQARVHEWYPDRFGASIDPTSRSRTRFAHGPRRLRPWVSLSIAES